MSSEKAPPLLYANHTRVIMTPGLRNRGRFRLESAAGLTIQNSMARGDDGGNGI